jgi:hypothetical protein
MLQSGAEVIKVRFVKRNKSWSFSGHRPTQENATDDTGAVASDERSALLSSVAEDPEWSESPVSAETEEEPSMKGDPTQHLLTALGRFQRQVNKAENGLPQEMWVDECMNQLIVGIEVAMRQDWVGVREAMTDTARILQSYENAGLAVQCVPFLQDSYEILCLMVGDLIVENVRSGVLQKWRDRYQHAVTDLVKAGLPLIEDEEEEEELSDAPNEERSVPMPETEQAPAWEPSPFAAAASEHDAHLSDVTLDFEEDNEEEPAAEQAYYAPAFEEPAPAPEPEPAHYDNVAPFDMPTDLPAEASVFEETPRLDQFADTVPLPGFDATPIEPQPEQEETAQQQEAVWPPEPEPEFESAPEPVETTPEPVAAAVESPSPASSAGESPQETLLRTTRDAMAHGNVADAKMMALQLAVEMARLEADQEAGKLTELKETLKNLEASIGAGESDVQRIEHEVAETEAVIAARQGEFEAKREAIASLSDRAGAIQKTVVDLDAQIRALQEQRQAELAKLDNMNGQLDEARAEESRIQTELDSLADAEDAARASLELAKRNVAGLCDARKEREAEIEDAFDALSQRQQSAKDIQTMLEKATGAGKPSAPYESGLLF